MARMGTEPIDKWIGAVYWLIVMAVVIWLLP